MKIKNENGVIIIPNGIKKAIVVNRNENIDLSECLDNYINKNRKTNCIIYDDDNKPLDVSRLSYVTIPHDFSFDNNFNLKQKTLLNVEFSNLIKENDKSFTSVQKIRESLKEFVVDDGTYKIIKILTKGINKCEASLELTNFDINIFLQFYSIYSGYIDNELRLIYIYNLLIYINRENFIILHIKTECGERTLEWINNIQHNNIMILIDSDAIVTFVDAIETIIIGKEDYLNTILLPESELLKIPYLLNSYILNNIHLQSEENIELINIFCNENSSFLVKNLA